MNHVEAIITIFMFASAVGFWIFFISIMWWLHKWEKIPKCPFCKGIGVLPEHEPLLAKILPGWRKSELTD